MYVDKTSKALIKEAAMVMYKDGDSCTTEQVHALVVFVEKLVFASFATHEEEFNYDYDYSTAIEYLERLQKNKTTTNNRKSRKDKIK